MDDDDNEKLLTLFTEEEVWRAFKDMGPVKAPGIDRFPALFYQRFWHIVGKDVSSFYLDVLNSFKNFDQLNRTNIVLIPKIPNPTSVTNFRQISLCNVLYKAISKIITNRFRGVLSKCIDIYQSAFVSGRLITDNVLVAYELLYTFTQKRVGKKGFMALKVDMSKGYDRVEWSFLHAMLLKLVFGDR